MVTCKITERREGDGRVLFPRECDCIALIFRASRVPYASGPFLRSPDNQRARKDRGYMQDRGFSSFASHMMKLSVTETEWRSPIRE